MQFPSPQHGNTGAPSTTETFTEEIMNFYSDGLDINFAFMQHAGIYKVSTKNEKFTEMVTAAARGYRDNKPVKVTLSGQYIIEMELAE